MGVLDKVGDVVFRNRREFAVLLVGLDNSGKSTIVNNLKQPPDKKSSVEIQPTIGMSQETIRLTRSVPATITVFDMSGQGRYRSMWERRLDECQAIVFVIDSSDRLRLVIAKDELYLLGNHPTVRERRLPFLFLINKLDAYGAVSPARIANALAIDRLFGKKIPWKLIGCNALASIGIQEGFEWLAQFVLDGDGDMRSAGGTLPQKSRQSPSTPPINGGADTGRPFSSRINNKPPTTTSLVMSSTTTSIPPTSNNAMKKSKSGAVLSGGGKADAAEADKLNEPSNLNANNSNASDDAADAKTNKSGKRKFMNWFRRSSSSKP